MRRITSVKVGVGPGYGCGLPERPRGAEEPQPVVQDRTSEGAVHVKRGDQRGWFQNPDAPQLVVDVVRPGPVAGPAVKCGPAELVAPRAWHEVHDRPAGFRLPQAARHEHLDLIDVG